MFAAPLGIAGRRTYTVLGDPVNVAARALGFAADGDVVVADGMQVDTRPHVDAIALGAMPLKNRVGPMPMWRVMGVRPQDTTTSARLPFAGHGGRRAEWARLTTAWKRTGDGTGAQLLLVSEPGMGASGLLEALADLAGAAGTAVVAHPFHESVPYAAITELTRALARSRRRRDRRASALAVPIWRPASR